MENTKILIADDDSLVREMLSDVLQSKGYITETAQNGADALEKYCSDPGIGLIISDMNMPEMSGMELVKELRNTKLDVPVIILTGSSEISTAIEVIRSGANDYLLKDENIGDTILLSIKNILEKKKMKELNLQLMADLALKNNELEKLNKQLEIHNRFIRETFGKYLSDEIVRSLIETPGGLKLGGEIQKVTIMMTDLRGFTSIAERLPAEDIVGILNIYLEAMTDIILKHYGTIDEFIGDAILVIFGAPICHDDDAVRAVACAVEMQTAMKEVNRRNREAGYPEIKMGIGINTGKVVVGNIGSKKRVKYGVVGSNINLASRIESYTIGGQILISESTMKDCGDMLRIDNTMEVIPKGVINPITIYEVGGIKGSYNLFLPKKEEIKMNELKEPLTIIFKVLEGKYAGDSSYKGAIIRMSDDLADIHADVTLDRLSNLRISLFDGKGMEITSDIYSKVIEKSPVSSSLFRIGFTSMPLEAKTFLKDYEQRPDFRQDIQDKTG